MTTTLYMSKRNFHHEIAIPLRFIAVFDSLASRHKIHETVRSSSYLCLVYFVVNNSCTCPVRRISIFGE